MSRADDRSSSRARAARPFERSRRSRVAARLLLLAGSWTLMGCEPKLVVGQWECPDDGTPIPARTDPISVPWSTSFEHRFCDYTQLAGFCYGDPHASYEIVGSPAHSGQHAAAFSVNTEDPMA